MRVQVPTTVNGNLMVLGKDVKTKAKFIGNLMRSNDEVDFFTIDGRSGINAHIILSHLYGVLNERYTSMTSHHTTVTNESPIVLIINDIDILSKNLSKKDRKLLGGLARLGMAAKLTIVTTSTSTPYLSSETLANLKCATVNFDKPLNLYGHSTLDD